MSNFKKIKASSYCVGGRHYSGTNNIRGVVSDKGTKMLKCYCVKCRRNKSMTVSWNKSMTVNDSKTQYIPIKAYGSSMLFFNMKFDIFYSILCYILILIISCYIIYQVTWRFS